MEKRQYYEPSLGVSRMKMLMRKLPVLHSYKHSVIRGFALSVLTKYISKICKSSFEKHKKCVSFRKISCGLFLNTEEKDKMGNKHLK